MLSGRLQGQLLSLLSKIIAPRTILEIGTFTGYSAICLAQGLRPNGQLHTIELDDELEGIIQKYLRQANLQQQVKVLFGDARTIIPTLPDTFDLVFIDADKAGYAEYYDLVINKIPSGGVILADNVLWKGKVVADAPHDKKTAVIDAFNKKILADERVENILLPLRDGIMMIRKR